MNTAVIMIISLVLGLLVGAAGVMIYRKTMEAKNKQSAETEADRILAKARSEAQRIDRDSKQRAKDFEARARKKRRK